MIKWLVAKMLLLKIAFIVTCHDCWVFFMLVIFFYFFASVRDSKTHGCHVGQLQEFVAVIVIINFHFELKFYEENSVF